MMPSLDKRVGGRVRESDDACSPCRHMLTSAARHLNEECRSSSDKGDGEGIRASDVGVRKSVVGVRESDNACDPHVGSCPPPPPTI